MGKKTLIMLLMSVLVAVPAFIFGYRTSSEAYSRSQQRPWTLLQPPATTEPLPR